MHHMMKGGPRGARRQKPLLLFPPFALRRHQKLYLINPPIPSTRQPTNQHPLSPFVIRAKKNKDWYLIYAFLSKYSPAFLNFKYNFLFPLPSSPSLNSTPTNSRPGSSLGVYRLRKLKPRILPPLLTTVTAHEIDSRILKGECGFRTEFCLLDVFIADSFRSREGSFV